MNRDPGHPVQGKPLKPERAGASRNGIDRVPATFEPKSWCGYWWRPEIGKPNAVDCGGHQPIAPNVAVWPPIRENDPISPIRTFPGFGVPEFGTV
jgi:hypothetical protein